MKQHIAPNPNNTPPTWVGLIRIALGFLLVWKGLAFIQDTSQLETIMERSGVGGLSDLASVTAAVVGIVTLLSGIFISVGLFTTPVAFTQIVIIGAGLIFLSVTNTDRNVLDVISTFIVLLLLVFYGIKGSGRISFDEALTKTSDFRSKELHAKRSS